MNDIVENCLGVRTCSYIKSGEKSEKSIITYKLLFEFYIRTKNQFPSLKLHTKPLYFNPFSIVLEIFSISSWEA